MAHRVLSKKFHIVFDRQLYSGVRPFLNSNSFNSKLVNANSKILQNSYFGSIVSINNLLNLNFVISTSPTLLLVEPVPKFDRRDLRTENIGFAATSLLVLDLNNDLAYLYSMPL